MTKDSITEKEIIIFDGKPMWLKDYKNNTPHIYHYFGIVLCSAFDYYNHRKDEYLCVVRVKEKDVEFDYFNYNGMYASNIFSERQFCNMEKIKSYSNYYKTNDFFKFSFGSFWNYEYIKKKQEEIESFIVIDEYGIIDILKTFDNINEEFGTSFEVIETKFLENIYESKDGDNDLLEWEENINMELWKYVDNIRIKQHKLEKETILQSSKKYKLVEI